MKVYLDIGRIAFYFDDWDAPNPNTEDGNPITTSAFFAFIGALSLLGSVPTSPGLAFWMLLAILAVGVSLFGWLLLRDPFPKRETPDP